MVTDIIYGVIASAIAALPYVAIYRYIDREVAMPPGLVQRLALTTLVYMFIVIFMMMMYFTLNG